MAGAKKKTLANKLAKMSDEERVRYLQHKADMEEEAKRRKEQLIATFMKKKIKKEDAFSRLNLAKINQNWHQILRRLKCQEMKENVGHLRLWIERLLDYKNRTISKLMDELEEAEEQYSNNYQCHSTHVDDIIGDQQKYMEKLEAEFDDDLFELLQTTQEETEMISNNSKDQEEHLMTVLYGQETEGAKTLREQYETNMTKLYEVETSFKEKLSSMRSAREKTCGDLWRQIAGVVRLCVHQTDSRRMHLAELRRLDAESAIEIADNEERIRKKEDLLNDLEKDYDNKLHERQVTVKHLENELEDLNKAFLKVKKNLQRDLQTDEKLLFFLTDLATQSLRYLEGVLKKGEHTRNLANTCKKFETEREKIFKYIPLAHRLRKYEGDVVDYQESLKIISEQMKAVGTVEDNVHLPLLKLPRKKSSGRPKTAASDTVSKSAVTSTSDSKRITTVKEVKIQFKASSRDAESSSSTYSTPRSRETSTKNIFERCFDSLQNLENFWLTFNQVEIDYMEIKEEKSVLEEENKKLRGMIRAVLEAAALSQPESNSRVSTRLPSKRRSAYSAPLRRVLFA